MENIFLFLLWLMYRIEFSILLIDICMFLYMCNVIVEIYFCGYLDIMVIKSLEI